jgi:hypothetical protein
MKATAALSKKAGSVRGQSCVRSHESSSFTNKSGAATSRALALGSRRSATSRMNLPQPAAPRTKA